MHSEAAGGTASPRVTVVLTVHRRVDYLCEALDSVLAQSLDDLEVVVAHDGDGEDVRALIGLYSDPRVRYRRNQGRPGIVDSLLGAVRSSSAPYLAVLNDDDVWEPEFLARLVPALDAAPDVAVAFCDHLLIDEAGRVDVAGSDANTRRWGRAGLRPGLHRPFWHLGLVDRSVPAVMGALFRRSALDWDDFPAEVATAYDFWLTYLACRSGHGAAYLPERLTRYRVHPTQATRTRLLTAPAQAEALRRAAADTRLPGDVRAILRARLQQVLIGWATELVSAGRRREARDVLAQARSFGAAGARAAVTRGIAVLPSRLGRHAVALARR